MCMCIDGTSNASTIHGFVISIEKNFGLLEILLIVSAPSFPHAPILFCCEIDFWIRTFCMCGIEWIIFTFYFCQLFYCARRFWMSIFDREQRINERIESNRIKYSNLCRCFFPEIPLNPGCLCLRFNLINVNFSLPTTISIGFPNNLIFPSRISHHHCLRLIYLKV